MFDFIEGERRFRLYVEVSIEPVELPPPAPRIRRVTRHSEAGERMRVRARQIMEMAREGTTTAPQVELVLDLPNSTAREALCALVKSGALRVVHQGGGRGNPTVYALAE
jgi:hypothetical protein